jgi:hypothetical protein
MMMSRADKPSVCRLATCFLALAAVSCGPAPAPDSTYFEQTSSAAQSGSAPAGTKMYVGLANLEIKPGDEVTFQSIETSAPGVRGLVGRLRETSAALGMATETEVTAVELAPYRDLGAPPFSSADGQIGIVIEVSTPTSQVDISTPVLIFSVNGGAPQRERLLMNLRICSAPATEPCPAPEPPPLDGG